MLPTMLFSAFLFCLFLWPAVAGFLKVTGFCKGWDEAFRVGSGAALLLYLVTAADLCWRAWQGKPLERGDDE
jgi:hypothetical protein